MSRPTASERGVTAASRGTGPARAKRKGGVRTLPEVTIEGDPRRADPPPVQTVAEQVIVGEASYEAKLAYAKRYAGGRGHIEPGDVKALGIGFWNALKPFYLPDVPVEPQHAGAEHMGRELALNLAFEGAGAALGAARAARPAVEGAVQPVAQGAVHAAQEAVVAGRGALAAQRVMAAAKSAIEAGSPSRLLKFLERQGRGLIHELTSLVNEPIYLNQELAHAGAPSGALRATGEAATAGRATSAAERGTAAAQHSRGAVKTPLKASVRKGSPPPGSGRMPPLATLAPPEAARVAVRLIKAAKAPIVLRDLTPEIVEAMKARHGSEQVALMFRRRGGIMAPYDALQAVTLGFEGRYQAHHIVEEHVLRQFGLPTDQAVAVVVTQNEHKALNTALADWIVTKLDLWGGHSKAAYVRAYEEVYWGMAEWLAEVRRALR
ncbi:MAG: hypothetical protein ACRDT1_10500 [Micromonosporaceae bacterium]